MQWNASIYERILTDTEGDWRHNGDKEHNGSAG